METEYEAKFLNIDIDEVRARLKAAGAKLERPEFFQRRWVFDLPEPLHSKNTFARVRDEGGVVTVTWKKFAGTDVDHPQEVEITADNLTTPSNWSRSSGVRLDRTRKTDAKYGCLAKQK